MILFHWPHFQGSPIPLRSPSGYAEVVNEVGGINLPCFAPGTHLKIGEDEFLGWCDVSLGEHCARYPYGKMVWVSYSLVLISCSPSVSFGRRVATRTSSFLLTGSTQIVVPIC